MRLLKLTSTLLLTGMSLMTSNLSAQTFIGNSSQIGSYLSDQDVVINNNSANTLTLDNDIDEPAILNFVGGEDNFIDGSENASVRLSLAYGDDNLIQNGVKAGFTLGTDNEIMDDVRNSFAMGNLNTITGFARGSFALGNENMINFSNQSFALGKFNEIHGGANSAYTIGGENIINTGGFYPISIGAETTNNFRESLLMGFGAADDFLEAQGNRSITLGTFSDNTSWETFNLRPPDISAAGDFESPVIGIGETDPEAKLEIVNDGAIPNTAKALQVESSDNDALFNVREDGAAGFNIPANPSNRPRAPYQFEESGLTPAGFPTGQGQANIVQNYGGFPSIGGESKWLALGERPPGPTGNQVAYGFASTWDAYSGNFFIEDFDEGPNDVTISFQDATTTNGATTAENRLRFIARDGQPIDPTNNSIAEIMSLYPERQVAVGDYSDNSLDPEANRLEIKTDRDCGPGTDCNDNGNEETIMEVLKNKNPNNPSGDPVFTVRDNGNVIIGNGTALGGANPGENFQVDGSAYTNGMWRMSDMRFKKDTQIIQEPLDKLSKIDGITYLYAENKYTQGRNFRMNERQSGILAQQLKQVLPEAVREGKGGLYSVNYDGIIPLLIEAHKTHQEEIKKQKQKIRQLKSKAQKVENLEQQIKELQKQVNTLQQNQESANRFKNENNQEVNERTVSIENKDGQNQAILLQNRPNPYSNETIIPYFLPRDFESASLLITNTNGQLVKRVSLQQPGKGELTIQTQDLNAGQYVYSLIVDGLEIQSRKMVVKK